MERLAYRVNEAAEMMGVSRSKMYELIAAGSIPVLRIGTSIRVPNEALREWLAQQTAIRAERQ